MAALVVLALDDAAVVLAGFAVLDAVALGPPDVVPPVSPHPVNATRVTAASVVRIVRWANMVISPCATERGRMKNVRPARHDNQ